MTDLTLAPDTDPVSLYRTRDELYAADMLIAALTGLDFFTWLDAHPGTIDDIAQHFGFKPRPVDVMTTLFVAMGLVERDGLTLGLTKTGREHLVAASPWFLGPYYPKINDRPIARDLIEVLRTGQPANFASRANEADWHKAMETEAFAEEFLAAMDCRGLLSAQALAKHLDLARSPPAAGHRRRIGHLRVLDRRAYPESGGVGVGEAARRPDCAARHRTAGLRRPRGRRGQRHVDRAPAL